KYKKLADHLKARYFIISELMHSLFLFDHVTAKTGQDCSNFKTKKTLRSKAQLLTSDIKIINSKCFNKTSVFLEKEKYVNHVKKFWKDEIRVIYQREQLEAFLDEGYQ